MDSKMKVENLDLYYGKFKALKNINLDLPKNEITAFIGPSGCGKSTLLKSLNRMNDLVEGCKITGKVTLDGDDIYGDMDVNLLRKRVGMVFQKPNPFPMSIYDNIAYGPRTHGIRSKAKLDDIVEKRKEQLQREKDNIKPQDMKEMALNSKNKNHGFKEALKKSGLSVISEVKKASPSKGVIAEDFRPVETAIAYEDAGAAAISCLTEEHYFKGGSKYFADIRAKVDIPMLRKDFIFDEYQIYEAKVLGADAILLIAAILSEEKIKEFYDLAKSLEIDCLVEVHNEKELKKVVACGCDIIGINNRKLKTFDVDLNTTSKLAPLIPYEAVLVSESGMKDENDMKNVKEQGADAVLIGETFMRSDNIKETMKQLRSCL